MKLLDINLSAFLFLILFSNFIPATSAQTTGLVVKADKPGARVPSTMFGVFFEDINYAADGGLYAEKIKNRSFEFPQRLTGWTAFGQVEVLDDGPFERAPHYVRLSPAGHPARVTGIENEGYFGVSVDAGEEYRLSLWARAAGDGEGALNIELADNYGHTVNPVLASARIDVKGDQWQKYTVTFTSPETADGRLRVMLAPGSRAVDVEHVSMFPVTTWLMHENGLRADLARRIAELHPGVVRFPGGCIVEGADLATRYNWKNTVGPVENRPLNENRWQTAMAGRLAPDYYQSYGLGFYEFFEFCEEIMAEPLPVISVGMACQFQNDSPEAHAPLDSLDSYIRDALDLIEFANGDTTTVWGSVRAQMGHPAPFGLKYIAIGNEQWGPEYPERLEPFVRAIRKEWPGIKIVGSAGAQSSGPPFEYLWNEMRRIGVDLVDEHFYMPEDWFAANATRYDRYPRRGPKVFAGEYACHGTDRKYNHFNASLMEAALMTGLERNADIVEMATYAPLLAHEHGWQWRPDMIWYDNHRSWPTASYFVQQIFSTNAGTHVLPLTLADGSPVTGTDGIYASAVLDRPTGEYVIKAVNISDSDRFVDVTFAGLPRGARLNHVDIITLHTDSIYSDNTSAAPTLLEPTLERVNMSSPASWTTLLPAKTLKVWRFGGN